MSDTRTPPPTSLRGRFAAAVEQLRSDMAIRRLFRNTGLLLGAKGLNLPLGLLESVLLARFLGVGGLGTYGIVVSFALVTQRLTSFRMNEMVVKYLTEMLVKKRRDLGGAVLKVGLLLEGTSALLAFGICCLAAPLAARYLLGDSAAAALFSTYASIILADSFLEASKGALQAFDRFAVQARVEVLRRILRLAGIAVVAAWGMGLQQVLVALVLAHAVTNAYQILVTLREARQQLGSAWWARPLTLLRDRWRELGRFGLTTNLSATLTLIVRDSDMLWLGLLRDPEDAGYYKFALEFLKHPFAASGPMVKAFFPEIARSMAQRANNTRQLLLRGTWLAAAWVVPLTVGIVLFTPWIVRTIFGAEYLPSVSAIYVLLIAYATGRIFFWCRPALLALGRPDIPLKIAAGQVMVKIALALLLVPTLGYLALAWILVILTLISLLISVVYCFKNIPAPS